MKDVLKNGSLILLTIAVLYIIFLRECKKPNPCPAKDEIIIKKNIWDSIQALAKKPPIIKIETTKIQGDPIYIHDLVLPQPKPEPKDSTINNYSDSLVRDNINVHYDFKVKGTLLDRSWTYIPTINLITLQKTVFVPHIIDRPVKVPAYGLFIYGQVGGNLNSFIPGAGLDFITKKSTEIGYLYQRFGNENIHSAKVGVKLFKNRIK